MFSVEDEAKRCVRGGRGFKRGYIVEGRLCPLSSGAEMGSEAKESGGVGKTGRGRGCNRVAREDEEQAGANGACLVGAG